MERLQHGWPNPDDKCYDCGSEWPGRHTLLCDFAEPGDDRTLPAIPGTQWVDHEEMWVVASSRTEKAS